MDFEAKILDRNANICCCGASIWTSVFGWIQIIVSIMGVIAAAVILAALDSDAIRNAVTFQPGQSVTSFSETEIKTLDLLTLHFSFNDLHYMSSIKFFSGRNHNPTTGVSVAETVSLWDCNPSPRWIMWKKSIVCFKFEAVCRAGQNALL